jgi:hypothetical protein
MKVERPPRRDKEDDETRFASMNSPLTQLDDTGPVEVIQELPRAAPFSLLSLFC